MLGTSEQKKKNNHIQNVIQGLSILMLSQIFIGCDQQNVVGVEANSQVSRQETAVKLNIEEQKLKLSAHEMKQLDTVTFLGLPAYAQPFVGRFQAIVECDQNFIPCQNGLAQVTLILQANGKLHRSIVKYGKLFKENKQDLAANENYAEDRWRVDPDAKEMEVVRADGLRVYYDIHSPDHLVVNLRKIKMANKTLFAAGYPQPEQVYELKRSK